MDLYAARRGDLRAYNRLVAAHQDQLYTLSYWALGDEQAATDIVQAAVIQARRNIPHLDARRFRLWLLRWAVAACRNWLVVSGAARTVPAPGQNVTPEQRRPGGLCGLPADLRMAVLLVDVSRLDYADAAMVLGTSRDQVSHLVAEARAQLTAEPFERAPARG